MNVYEINDAWNHKWDDEEIKKKYKNLNELTQSDDKQDNILNIGFINILKIYFIEYFNFILPIITLLFIFIIMKLKY